MNILKHRSLLTFTALVIGLTLVTNLIYIAQSTDTVDIYMQSIIIMLLANLICLIGFIVQHPKMLGYSIAIWIFSIPFNFGAAIGIIPIIILNWIGRNKMESSILLSSNGAKDEEGIIE